MKIAIIYSSRTGNTEELVKCLYKRFLLYYESSISLNRIDQFTLSRLSEFDGIVIGTYTWGDGNIPPEMLPLYKEIESQQLKHMITGVVGTGDRFYSKFCGAVEDFKDMLYVQTTLAVTLKIELSPQLSDIDRCHTFVDLFLKRVRRTSFV